MTDGALFEMNENVFLDFSQHIHILVAAMRQLNIQWIIHIFAALHVVTTIVCRLAGLDDELLLTLLTMTMIVIICLRRSLSLELTAAMIILVNVVGYILGTQCADLIDFVLKSPIAVHAVSTFFTTEILGQAALGLGKLFYRLQNGKKPAWSPRLAWVVVTVTVIFLFRFAILAVGRMFDFSEGIMYEMLTVFFSNLPAIIILLCLNTIYIRFSRVHFEKAALSFKLLALATYMSFAVLLGTFLVGYGIPFTFARIAEWPGMLSLAVVVFISETVIYVIAYLLDYLWASNQALKAEKQKRHKAQFEYLKLKQQVDPHFLFNSLNVLDCLVLDEQTEEAHTFIHKLAGMYRYMLKNENMLTISLMEEMAFVNMYADLMKVRFQSGFVLEVDVPDAYGGMYVVPCSIQMLLENALKHNAANPDDPLVVRISIVEEKKIRVSNNLRKRKTANPEDSTRVGLNYIRQQYMDQAGLEISAFEQDGLYVVELPLIEQVGIK